MKAARAFAIAFSLYSRIPMPRFDWKKEDMRLCIAFFPWVGAVIGLVYYGVVHFGKLIKIPDIALVLIMTAVPLLITGGFHVDGYMDTKDALNSYKSREEKLKILKDPHTGAFAVIWLGICGLVYIAAQMVMISDEAVPMLAGVTACGFVLARCMSAFCVILLKPARDDGMMKQESEDAIRARKGNLIILAVEALAALAGMFLFDWKAAAFAVAAAICWCLIYANRCSRIFGGTTGDTAGYFLVKCEVYMTVAVAAAALIFS